MIADNIMIVNKLFGNESSHSLRLYTNVNKTKTVPAFILYLINGLFLIISKKKKKKTVMHEKKQRRLYSNK